MAFPQTKAIEAMDWLTFISKVIDSCAWPIVLGLVFIKYKNQIIKLIGSLESIKIGDIVDAKFSKEVLEVASKSEELLPNEDKNLKLSLSDTLSALPPRLAIIEAYNLITKTVNEVLVYQGYFSKEDAKRGRVTPIEMLHKAKSSGIFSDEQFELLNKLRRLRNQIVHGEDGVNPTLEDAKNYVDSAVAFTAHLKSAYLPLENGS
ncbi:HEPN domain-containing protein [Enterobacter soli]|uniref:HEPN domain-containing protein n=1 Tax=Enterobacter soli TaxID=885040 RepID=UPI003F85151A